MPTITTSYLSNDGTPFPSEEQAIQHNRESDELYHYLLEHDDITPESNLSDFVKALLEKYTFTLRSPMPTSSITTAPDHIKIWDWPNAPEEYQALSPHGGDEDYIVFVPIQLAHGQLDYMLDNRPHYGDEEPIIVPNGHIYIHAHA